MRNMPILYQNIMSGLPCEKSRAAFLWATEQPGNDRMCYKAEAFAHEVAKIGETLPDMLDQAAKQHGKDSHDKDLMEFILTRHANWRYGGNKAAPSYTGKP